MTDAHAPRLVESASPPQPLHYGDHPEQFGELRLPPPGSGPWPVAVLLHGGLWLSRWKLDLMDALSADLVQRGIATWNVEYRRADRHGWRATTADVEAAVLHLEKLARRFPIDAARSVLFGHSAGGQLAIRVAADLLAARAFIRPAMVVSLAGYVDLVEAERRNLGDGAVAAALGGTPDDLPDVYRTASPRLRLPLGVPQLIVTAREDSPDLNELNRGYAAAALKAGDIVTAVDGDGDHFTLIDPASRAWADTMAHVEAALMPRRSR